MDFINKTVLITGGSRGIGKAIALTFADHGARVAINYVSNDDAAEETLKNLPGGPHIKYKADISNPDGILPMIETVVRNLGSLDILVNNAGVNLVKPFLKLTEQEWNTVLDTNLKGCFYCCQAVGKGMVERKTGSSSTNCREKGTGARSRWCRGVPMGSRYDVITKSPLTGTLSQRKQRRNVRN
jgi:3-oxoacyl-[acyl-carrier protein] reductase